MQNEDYKINKKIYKMKIYQLPLIFYSACM